MEPVEPVQMNIYQSNTYRKDLNWINSDNEPRVQERERVKDQQSWISIFVAYLTISSRISCPDMTAVFHAWPYGKFIEIQSQFRRKKLHKTNQGANFLGLSLRNRDNIRAPIQIRREIQPKLLKTGVLLKNRSIHCWLCIIFKW